MFHDNLDWDVPLVVALARSERPGDPAVVVSAAAATDLATACRRALKELSANLALCGTCSAADRSSRHRILVWSGRRRHMRSCTRTRT